MPLRDHFRPPVEDRHSWDELHGTWPSTLVQHLSRLLPTGYYAAPLIHLGGSVEIDVGTYEREERRASLAHSGENGGTATTEWTGAEPTLRVESDLPDVDEYEVRVYDVRHERRLVAAIEIVSPSNKDRPASRQAFVSKCAALLRNEVSVTIVDVATTRDFNLYSDLLTLLGRTDPSVADPPSNIYGVTCRHAPAGKRWLLEAWHFTFVIGRVLPALPIWLSEDQSITLDLEASYEECCRANRQPFTTGGYSPLRRPDLSQTSTASVRFSRASSMLAPCVRQPGKSGASATTTSSCSPFSKTAFLSTSATYADKFTGCGNSPGMFVELGRGWAM